MLKNMSIKIKLALSFAIIALLVLILALYNIKGVSNSSEGFSSYREMAKGSVLASRVQSNMLMVRLNVISYFKTAAQKDVNGFNHYYDITQKFVNEALKEIKKAPRAGYIKEIEKEFSIYKKDFLKVIFLMEKANDIVNKNLNVNGKKIEKLLTKVMNSAKKDGDKEAALETGEGLRTLLLARLYTAKFIESNTLETEKRAIKEFELLKKELKDIENHIQNPNRIQLLKQSIDLITIYEKGLEDLSDAVTKRNIYIANLSAIGPKIAKLAEDVKSSIREDQAKIGLDVTNLNDNVHKMTIIIASVVLLLVLLFATFISKDINTQLLRFQTGLADFFKYLNRETNSVEKLDEDGKNEIATMSKAVNENIEKTKKGIEEDRKFIDETVVILSEFEQGDLAKRITSEVSNPALMDLRNVINSMGEHLEDNINETLKVLEKYTHYNYLDQVQTSNVKHHLLKLAQGVNNLGSSIVTMLTEEKRVGLGLNSSSDTLLQNVNVLNDVSNEAAASLEETAAALEEMTGTIVSNTQNVIDMAEFANKVTKSVDEGNDLANQTTSSMDEINDKVTSINEAITVIDQIAFQTNILSLNAAVEAATAGEAGKGFAVVAQEVRNLASRSAEAAKEIKDLVEDANAKANSGKIIADKMIHGYTELNENIKKTIELIKQVESASKEQQSGIEQINDAVTVQDQQTQKIANAANETQEIAIHTSHISKTIVEKVDEKEFSGKDDIVNRRAKNYDLNYDDASCNRGVEKAIRNHNKRRTKTTLKSKTEMSKPKVSKSLKTMTSNAKDDDEWESF